MLSTSPSLSEALYLRFSLADCSTGIWFAVVAVAGCSEAGCSKAVVVGSGVVIWAEIVGEVEAGGFGMAGWSEAIRGIRFGIVSSARTKAEAGYPQMVRKVLAEVLCTSKCSMFRLDSSHLYIWNF